jgi:disulfide bond formation protein DsbB
VQRGFYYGVALVFALAALHSPGKTGKTIYCSLATLLALGGFGVAGRQVWLQHLPADQVPECGPGLEFMLEMYTPFDVLKRVLRGTGDCAKVDWTFLSFSIAEWSLFCFSLILFTAFIQWRAARRREWR